jgi:hypothetical protein
MINEDSEEKEIDVKFTYTVNADGWFICTALVQGNIFAGKSLSSYGDAKSSARMMVQKFLNRPPTTVEKMVRMLNGIRI